MANESDQQKNDFGHAAGVLAQVAIVLEHLQSESPEAKHARLLSSARGKVKQFGGEFIEVLRENKALGFTDDELSSLVEPDDKT